MGISIRRTASAQRYETISACDGPENTLQFLQIGDQVYDPQDEADKADQRADAREAALTAPAPTPDHSGAWMWEHHSDSLAK